MKRFMGWIVVTVLLAGLSTFGDEEINSTIPENTAVTNMTDADVLWAGMHAAGMIDDEQYLHVQETGYLPGGTTVQNSPITAESQANWNQLAQHEVITSDELAAMIFDGDIPGLTEEEEQAFEALAPVYQPNRARRLTYDVRSKHARVELIRLAHRVRAEREALVERARLLDIPVQVGDGILIHIDEQGHPYYSEPLGMGSCDTISTDEVWTTNAIGQVNTNFNLSGTGITLAMWDLGGVNETHQEFAGRVENYAGAYHMHSCAVAAVMIGAGISTNAHGMASAATLHAYERTVYDLDELAMVITNGLIRFSNHSYKTYGGFYGQYIDYDEDLDDLVYKDYYHLPVWAVGNEGIYYPPTSDRYDTLVAGYARNVLGVGAVEELVGGYAGASNVVMTYYSSWGPTDDGRIKPDLVASGFPGLIPHVSDNTSYYDDEAYVGTSFAAPAVTGSLGLLQELYEQLSGTNAIPLLASTYKGLAIHTADEAGAAPGPDYRFGWGLMNTCTAAQLMAGNAQWNSSPFIKEIMLPDGEAAFFPVEADTNLPLRITICWSDPPGATLQNDIDLRIIDPAGHTNFPWVLNPTNGFRGNPATRGDNTRDNVEQVEITNTVAGAYTVLINHKGTLVDGGQDVSVVLSGLLPENIDPDIGFSFTTNGFPLVEIPDMIGSIYEISHSDDLRYSSHWEEASESPLPVLHPQTEWIDSAGSTNPVRFYKIQQIK